MSWPQNVPRPSKFVSTRGPVSVFTTRNPETWPITSPSCSPNMDPSLVAVHRFQPLVVKRWTAPGWSSAHRGKHAQLLEQRERVGGDPALDDATAGKPKKVVA